MESTLEHRSPLRNRVIQYIIQRRCEAGGFCFYRLEEPNGSDTYYALATLKLLNYQHRDDKTVAYLKGTQWKDGAFGSISAAFYAVMGLRILDAKPACDPVPYILRNIRIHHIENLPVGVSSIFQPLHLLSNICVALGIALQEDWRKKIGQFVFAFQNTDRGFGHPISTLAETKQATDILKWLSCPIERFAITDFIVKCESSNYGFVNVPATSPSFLEYIHAGISVSQRLAYQPRYLEKCIKFIIDCQNTTGGFSRATHTGIATMENTFLGIHALSLIAECGILSSNLMERIW